MSDVAPGRVGMGGQGVRLSVRAEGPVDGPLLVLLHGFPESARAFEPMVRRLAAEGFRVRAPDQRGYGDSDKPSRVSDMALDHLVADVRAIVDAEGGGPAVVVGHDWGAAVAWAFAATHPERVRALIPINVPHPSVMKAAILSPGKQARKSWYIYAFQLPWLPELALRSGRLAKGLARTARRGAFSEALLSELVEEWRRPGAARGMINWYRAAFRYRSRLELGTIEPPTLVLWGDRDAFLEKELADLSLERCANGRLIHFPEHTHWICHEAPERMVEEIVAFAHEVGEAE